MKNDSQGLQAGDRINSVPVDVTQQKEKYHNGRRG